MKKNVTFDLRTSEHECDIFMVVYAQFECQDLRVSHDESDIVRNVDS